MIIRVQYITLEWYGILRSHSVSEARVVVSFGATPSYSLTFRVKSFVVGWWVQLALSEKFEFKNASTLFRKVIKTQHETVLRINTHLYAAAVSLL